MALIEKDRERFARHHEAHAASPEAHRPEAPRAPGAAPPRHSASME
jgi:hypothetical protein